MMSDVWGEKQYATCAGAASGFTGYVHHTLDIALLDLTLEQ